MGKKNFKRFAALALAATMTVGSAMTVFAADGDAPAGTAEGNGSYEGGEMKYPTMSVTLPTIPAGTYDYIADPNGLIAATSNEKYTDATFTGTTGIFFETETDTYTEKSAAQTVTNENAQDIDVTVKLEQKTAGDAIIKYADSATFDSADTENKLYLAITDDATTDAQVAALTATGAATLTTTVAGVPENYEPGYNSTDDKYEYTLKTTGLADWKECSFILTGAVNTNATWGDEVDFPAIKVTWSVKEHTDAYVNATSVSAASKSLTLTAMSEGTSVSKVELVLGGAPVVLASGNQYIISGTTINFAKYASSWVGGTLKITYSDGHVDEVTCQ